MQKQSSKCGRKRRREAVRPQGEKPNEKREKLKLTAEYPPPLSDCKLQEDIFHASQTPAHLGSSSGAAAVEATSFWPSQGSRLLPSCSVPSTWLVSSRGGLSKMWLVSNWGLNKENWQKNLLPLSD